MNLIAVKAMSTKANTRPVNHSSEEKNPMSVNEMSTIQTIKLVFTAEDVFGRSSTF